MSVLQTLVSGLREGAIEVVDLTAQLHSGTPILKLPPPFATPSARNQSRVIDRPAGAQLKVPAGFTVEEFRKFL